MRAALARCLIIGCGCRGRGLARELIARGHAVRGTTRRPERVSEIEEVGAEGVVGNPDVVGTLARWFEHVSVACVLLGSALGASEHLAALHAGRLDMLLTRMVDTTVRGVVYEAAGSVDQQVLERGAALVRERCEDARIPYVLLRANAAEYVEWTSAAVDAVHLALDGEQVGRR